MGGCCSSEVHDSEREKILDSRNGSRSIEITGDVDETAVKRSTQDIPQDELLKRAGIIHDIVVILDLLDDDSNQVPAYNVICQTKEASKSTSEVVQNGIPRKIYKKDEKICSETLHKSIMEGLSSSILETILERIKYIVQERDDLKRDLVQKETIEGSQGETESRSEEEKDMSERFRAREDLERVIRAKLLASSQAEIATRDSGRDSVDLCDALNKEQKLNAELQERIDEKEKTTSKLESMMESEIEEKTQLLLKLEQEIEARKKLELEFLELQRRRLEVRDFEAGSTRSIYFSAKSDDGSDDTETSLYNTVFKPDIHMIKSGPVGSTCVAVNDLVDVHPETEEPEMFVTSESTGENVLKDEKELKDDTAEKSGGENIETSFSNDVFTPDIQTIESGPVENTFAVVNDPVGVRSETEDADVFVTSESVVENELKDEKELKDDTAEANRKESLNKSGGENIETSFSNDVSKPDIQTIESVPVGSTSVAVNDLVNVHPKTEEPEMFVTSESTGTNELKDDKELKADTPEAGRKESLNKNGGENNETSFSNDVSIPELHTIESGPVENTFAAVNDVVGVHSETEDVDMFVTSESKGENELKELKHDKTEAVVDKPKANEST